MSLTRCTAIFVIVSGTAHAAPCVQYGAHTVTGTVHRVMFYGPPNYGEDPKTDQKGFYPVLKLDHAVSLCPNDTQGFANGPVRAREMQMIFLSGNNFRKSLYGKHVEVSGAMFAAETGSHHTPVMLEVKNIRVTP